MDEIPATQREGFELCEITPAFPDDFALLDPKTQRELEICDLFLSGNFTIAEIVRLSDEDYKTVIRALVEQGVVKDRRRKEGMSQSGIERRKPAS